MVTTRADLWSATTARARRFKSRGWGIAMSIDKAFALGLLTLLGGRARDHLRAFMLTVVIADDWLALVVTAPVYSDSDRCPGADLGGRPVRAGQCRRRDRRRMSGTPTFFITGRHHHVAYDIDYLSRAVRAAGARAKLAARRIAHVSCRPRAVLAIRLRPVSRST